jgi:hypothetical protein
MSQRSTIGAALGEAACHAVDAYHALVRMVLVMSEANVYLDEDATDVVEDVGALAEGMIALADAEGHQEVGRLSEVRSSGSS